MSTGVDGRTAVWLERARLLLRERGAQADLYNRWFHGYTGRLRVWPPAGAYRGAILDPARFERGWRVVATAAAPAAACVAACDDRRRIVAPPEMVPDDPRCLSLREGTALQVDPLASAEVNGFWHLWSAGWQVKPPERLDRIYARVEPRHALDLAFRVANEAAAHDLWTMKALCGAHDEGRRDGALLYLPAGADLGSDWVSRVLATLAPLCRDDLPPFVQPIWPGLGWAPDPGDGRSFGQAICDAVTTAARRVGDAIAFASAALDAIGAVPGMDRRFPPVGDR